MKPPTSGRYSYEDAAREVERYLAKRGRGAAKELAASLHMTEQQFSHRMRGVYAKFTLEHFGVMADEAIDPDSGRKGAPLGWPFIPWVIGARAFSAK